jgi:hypothetical protein
MPEVSVPLSAPGVSTEGLYLWHSPVTRPVYLQGGQTGLDKGLPAIIQSERTPGSEPRAPVGASVSWPWSTGRGGLSWSTSVGRRRSPTSLTT